MSDTPTTPVAESEPGLPPRKETSKVADILAFISLLILIVGGFITGHGFFGVLWLVIQWMLWCFLLVVVVGGIASSTKTPSSAPGPQHAIGWGALVIAMLVF